MRQSDVQALYQRFVTLFEAYDENPDVLTALALDRATGQLRQACLAAFGTGPLEDLLHRLLRAVSEADMGELHRLRAAIRNAVEEYGLA